MSTRCTTPQAVGRRVDEVGDLVGAEGDGHVGADVRRRRAAPVSTSTPDGHVDGDDRHAREARQRPPPRRSRSPRPAADADDPVDDDVGRRARRRPSTTRPPARAQRGEPAGVHPVGESSTRLDRAPRAGRAARRRTARRRRCRPGPTSSSTRAPYARPEQVERRRTPARSRPAASARPRAAGHQRGLGRAHLLDGVCAPHAPTLIRRDRPVGSAPARPRTDDLSGLEDHDGGGDAGVVGQRDVDAAARRARRPGRHRAADLERGSPVGALTISASCQAIPSGRRAPWPAPPWRRTGRPATPAAAPPRRR